MTPFERLIQFLTTLVIDPWIFIKLLFLIGLLIYIAFAVVVVQQVKLMSKTLNGVFDLPLRLFSLIYLVAAIFVFILAVVIL